MTPAVLNQAGDTAVLTVIPRTAPDSTATGRLPRWIDRVLPDVDIEGARLVTHAPEATDAPPAELVRN
ncbi:hypothetical protein [Streptomyces sp. NPDC058572]|uniref:hypothetical protein n=1 Tax=Streptomyces sp. NPDC058572 TaxID=3346546 RepID=UPI00365BFACE